MSIQDHIASYAEGWTLGDSDMIMSAVSPSMVLDDPNVGKVMRDALPDYIAGLKNAVIELRAGSVHDKLMEMSEIVIKDDRDVALVELFIDGKRLGKPIVGVKVIKERFRISGKGGRNRKLLVRATDTSGNEAQTSVTVTVPHDQGN